MSKKKKTKTKVNKQQVDVQPVKWRPGDERKPQGYWTDGLINIYLSMMILRQG